MCAGQPHQPGLQPYQHAHSTVEEIPWSRLGTMLIELAAAVHPSYRPDLVVGIAKGGVVPGVYCSSAFAVDFFPIKLSSRKNERVVSEVPVWHVYPTDQVRDKRVLLVDDISIAGRTLQLATAELRQRGASAVRTATLATHPGSFQPDYCVLETPGLIVWPWDRDQLLPDGRWVINPEYLREMAEVGGYVPTPSPAREPEGRWL
jgi:hypoxanthine phosphoribosyltransferase